MPTFEVGKLFSDEQLQQAVRLHRAHNVHSGSFAKMILLPEIVLPSMEHINKVTDQENDPMYIAYMLERICHKIKQMEQS